MELPSGTSRYSCDSAAQTLEWMKAIANFLKPFKHLLDAHVVNFFKVPIKEHAPSKKPLDRLWESVDREWMDCLRCEPVENLLKIPSGIVRESWPASLKEFVCTSRSLVLPREPQQLQMMLPGLYVASIGSVLAQGMNMKKKHEIGMLVWIVLKGSLGATGYLAQVLSFEYQLSVMAIDASSHHGNVTSARAERIKKHYAAKIRRSQAGDKHLNVPQTVTCNVLSSDTLKTLSASLLCKDNVESPRKVENSAEAPLLVGLEVNSCNPHPASGSQSHESSLVLAGLHACGDLSVTMLSNGAKLCALSLGKNARDLACQSAERWRGLTKDAALQNFQVHAFRAAFQMVLDKYYPEVVLTSPSIGRQGKAFRRQQLRRGLHPQLHEEKNKRSPSFAANKSCETDTTLVIVESTNVSGAYLECNDLTTKGLDKFGPFEAFSKSGLYRLGLVPTCEVDRLEIWKEAQHFIELVGPYWSLRSLLGPVVETFLLLDRLLFLQEQHGSVREIYSPSFNKYEHLIPDGQSGFDWTCRKS
ncbi:hypothetical protein ACLOJK_021688 [Asimina triloba]